MIKYCVIKNTTTIIDGSTNTTDVMLRNAINSGFIAEQVEIITQEQYDERKALEPQPTPQPTELEALTNHVLDVDMRLVMVEMGLL